MAVSTASMTLAEFLALPETKPVSEFINGRVYQQPMAQGKPSTLQTRLADTINAVGLQQKTAYAFAELRCTFAERSVVPDIAVFQWSRIPFDDNGEVANTFNLAPDWTIEILSPEQSQTRVIHNILFCLEHGAGLGWLIDPAEQAVLCFQPNQLPAIKQQPEESLPLPGFLDLDLSVGQLFAWLKLS